MACRLYCAYRTASLAPEILVQLGGIVCKRIYLNLPQGEHKEKLYKKINTYAKVPTFITENNEVITETVAILDNICATYDLPYIYEKDNPLYWQYLQKILFLTNTIQPTYRLWYHPHDYSSDARIKEAVQHSFFTLQTANWHYVNDTFFMDGTSPYIMGGEHFTINDIMVIMLVTWFPNYKKNLLDIMPNIKQCFDACLNNKHIYYVMQQHKCLYS